MSAPSRSPGLDGDQDLGALRASAHEWLANWPDGRVKMFVLTGEHVVVAPGEGASAVKLAQVFATVPVAWLWTVEGGGHAVTSLLT